MEAAAQQTQGVEPKLKIDKFADGPVVCLKLVGTIDEQFDGKKVASTVKGGTLVLDMAEIVKISSFGIREWVDFVGRASQNVDQIYLIDEIHTPDSSRYWVEDSYAARFAAGQDPEGLDKEFVRLWLAERMEDPYTSPIPTITEEDLEMFSRKYRALYAKMTGHEFESDRSNLPIQERIIQNIQSYIPTYH